MARRIYKTNKGKTLDMEALRQANEKTTAAGNMSVNAKGDIVRGGKIVKTAKDRVASSYNKVTQVEQVSLKKPLTDQDTKAEPAEALELPEMDDTQMTTETYKQRSDGTRYKEVLDPDGNITVEELESNVTPDAKTEVKKQIVAKSKRKAKKKKATTKKRPTV